MELDPQSYIYWQYLRNPNIHEAEAEEEALCKFEAGLVYIRSAARLGVCGSAGVVPTSPQNSTS